MARMDAVSVAVPLRRAQPRPQQMLSAFDGDTRGHTLLRMDAAAPHDVQPARTRGMTCNVHQRQRQLRRCSARRRSQRAAWLACACAWQLLVVRCKNGWPSRTRTEGGGRLSYHLIEFDPHGRLQTRASRISLGRTRTQ